MNTEVLPSAAPVFRDHPLAEALPRTLAALDRPTTVPFSTWGSITARKAELAKLPKHRAICAMQVAKAQQGAQFCFAVVSLKLADVVRGLLYSMNAGSPLVLAGNARSFLEHVASAADLVREVQARVDSIANLESCARAKERLAAMDPYLERFFAGSSRIAPDGPKPLHVHDLIRRGLADRVAGAMEAYEFLCDFVHPNYGSNLMVAGGRPGEGVLYGGGEAAPAVEPVVRRVLDTVATLASSLEQLQLDNFGLGMRLDHYFVKLLHGGLKESRVFGPARGGHTGTGDSEGSPIRFHSAVTYLDHMELQAAMMARLDPLKLAARRPVHVVAGEVVEVWESPLRSVYFQLPLPNPEMGVFAGWSRSE